MNSSDRQAEAPAVHVEASTDSPTATYQGPFRRGILVTRITGFRWTWVSRPTEDILCGSIGL